MSPPLDVAPSELVALRAAGTSHLVVDCREQWEYDLAHLPDAKLIPLSQLAARVAEVPRDRPVVVYCHHGMRSRRGAELLRAQGITLAQSLAGGIDRWALEVDPSLPRY